jgi:hypothetical protein
VPDGLVVPEERQFGKLAETDALPVPAVPGTRLKINSDLTVDRLYDDGRIERVQWQRKP